MEGRKVTWQDRAGCSDSKDMKHYIKIESGDWYKLCDAIRVAPDASLKTITSIARWTNKLLDESKACRVKSTK